MTWETVWKIIVAAWIVVLIGMLGYFAVVGDQPLLEIRISTEKNNE